MAFVPARRAPLSRPQASAVRVELRGENIPGAKLNVTIERASSLAGDDQRIVARNRHAVDYIELCCTPLTGPELHAVVRPLRDKQVVGTGAGLAVGATARSARDVHAALPI